MEGLRGRLFYTQTKGGFMRDRKLDGCFHDVKNKLACILGAVTLILRKGDHNCGHNCEHQGLLNSIELSALEISNIVHRCQKQEDSKTRRDLLKIDLHELLQPESHMYKTMMKCGLEMQLDIQIVNKLSKGCSVLATPESNESGLQFVNNIFFNSKKANATSVRIVAVEHDAYVAIHVVDNGDGMTAETLSCLGLCVASKTSTGKGTRIVQEIALTEGVACEWSSPGLGAGACVTIRMTKYKEVI